MDIVYYWKHGSKIIFKCMNSVVSLSFKEKVVEYGTCGSCEQCTRSTEKALPLGNKQNILPKQRLSVYVCEAFSWRLEPGPYSSHFTSIYTHEVTIALRCAVVDIVEYCCKYNIKKVEDRRKSN